MDQWRHGIILCAYATSTNTASTKTTTCARTQAAWAARTWPSPAAPSIRSSRDYAQELAEAGGASASYKIVPGSDHFYPNHEAEVIEILADWLKQFKS